MAASTIEELLVEIDATTQGLREEMGRAEQVVKQSGSRISTAAEQTAAAFKKAFGFLTAGYLVHELKAFSLDTIRSLDDIAKSAQAAGVTGEELQRLRFAFGELAGTVDGEVDDSLRRFNRRLGLARDGGGPAVQTFRRLGVELSDAGGHARDTQSVLDDTVAALASISDSSLRAALASAVFGEDQGPKLAAALAQGIEALNKAKEATRGLIGEDRLAEAEALDDALGRMAKTIEGELGGAISRTTFDLADMFGLTKVLSETELKRARLLEDIARTQERINLLEHAGPLRLAVEGGQEALDYSRNRLKDLQAQLAGLGKSAGHTVTESISTSLKSFGFSGNVMFPVHPKIELESPYTEQQQLEQQLTAQGFTGKRMLELPVVPSIELEPLTEELTAGQRELRALGQGLGESLKSGLGDYLSGIETDWKGLLRRMAIEAAESEVFSALANLTGPAGTFFKFLGFGGARAGGGDVRAGTSYLVGEAGPERFTPFASGHITPADKLGSGLSIGQINVDARGATDPAAIATAAKEAVIAAVHIADSRRNAQLSRLARPSIA